jgi:hypothetical protein
MATARDQYEELLVQLHREMKEGRRDGERADQIGEEMTRLWAELDDHDRDLFDELSEDLYLIEGKRLVAPLEEGETVESIWRRSASAFKDGRNRETLALVRKLSELGAQHSHVIGQCWERLGFFRGAECFYDFAFEQERKSVCTDYDESAGWCR